MVGILGFLIGAVLGSFSGAWADRYIKNKSMWGRSECISCSHKLSWYDLVPIVSYFLNSGKCRYCGKKIPYEDLLVEIILGSITAILFLYQFPTQSYKLLFELFVLTVLSTVFIIDLKVGLIPDKIVFPAVLVSILYWIIGIMGGFGGSWEEFAWALICASGASLFFAFLILVTRGRGMGWGDVKFVFFLGLILGFPNILIGLFLSFLFGAVISLLMIFRGKKSFGATVPFGPFLSLGTIATILYGEKILIWYVSLLRY
jgi:prepilin signal peptidase PulO-like enzyme (type II secretory pathway)